jgi:perosamine synthetase
MIPHNRPTVESDDIKAVADTLAAGFLSQGEAVKRFEVAFSRMHAGRHAIAVNSGTSALHLALRALGVRQGDEVIIPSYVCASLLNAVRYAGGTAVFADIDLDDLNISPADIKKKVTGKTKAVIVPHMFGLPAKMEEIVRIGIPVVEDCAQTIGVRTGGKMVGTLGKIAIFSFFSTKVMTSCGEGGMVITKSARLGHIVHGLRDYDEKDDAALRYNYKMTDVSAAMGLSQMRKLGRFIAQRRERAELYSTALQNTPLFLERDGEKNNMYFRYLVWVGKGHDRFLKSAARNKIGIKRPVYRPLHGYFNVPDKKFPNTSAAWRNVFSVPLYPSLPKKDIEKVISFLL